jgi:hypothetical protein
MEAKHVPAMLWALLRGQRDLAPESFICGHDLNEIFVECDRPLPLQLDGEDLGDVVELAVTSERHALLTLARPGVHASTSEIGLRDEDEAPAVLAGADTAPAGDRAAN